MKTISSWGTFAAIAAAVSLQAQHVHAKGFAVVGTLTCTTSRPAEGRADAKLSCNFRTKSGNDRAYTGSIARVGAGDIPEGKRVLLWTVLERSGHSVAIDGLYRGETGGTPSGVLVGGKEGSIRLVPVSATSQVGGTPTPTILELRLAATKV